MFSGIPDCPTKIPLSCQPPMIFPSVPVLSHFLLAPRQFCRRPVRRVAVERSKFDRAQLCSKSIGVEMPAVLVHVVDANGSAYASSSGGTRSGTGGSILICRPLCCDLLQFVRVRLMAGAG